MGIFSARPDIILHMKRFLILILLLFSSLGFSSEIRCEKKLQSTLETIRQLPEAEKLLQKVLEEGSISVEMNRFVSNQFEGYWAPNKRTIYITEGQSEADRLVTMLFEMHNAKRDKDFKELDRLALGKKIDQNEYVQRAERIEYENCVSTSKLLTLGRERGIFSKECRWDVADTFDEHFKWMKRSGHAAWHADSYKSLG